MPTDESKIKKSVCYKILIKSHGIYYKIGSVIIRTYSGDLLYIPSAKFHDVENFLNKEIDHISWHQSGRVSIKYKDKDNPYSIIEKKEDRQKISEIGFQDLIDDTIVDYSKLPVYSKEVIPLDVVFDVDDYLGAVIFKYSMVSGKLIIAYHNSKNTPLTLKSINTDSDLFHVEQRALGWHSGSADVMLQYSLQKTKNTGLRTNREICIPFDRKISKKGYE